jgi:mono/diheme cytochrome c family protein
MLLVKDSPITLTLLALVLAALPATSVAAGPGAAPVFSRDILPILSDNCFRCHGPDARARKADLRLDTAEGARSVLTPGKSADSEIIRRVASTNRKEQMPPPKSNRKLTPAQIDLLRRWVDAGAKWGKHWALEKPERPQLPHVRAAGWPRNPIDAFMLARLEAEGLGPAPEAARETLIRRVSLDLTGLPPPLEEVEAFCKDASPDAYEKVVDRLLASPHYGERMVWDWLDAARYADSNGYQGDGERTMWPWRDWAVSAMNRNLPFDQITVEQLAGDLLPGATAEQKLATGFCRNHMINGEGGRIAEENRVDYVMDMAETTGTVWLGLTLNCCRCHDHKFDPLRQREYYGLFAFFNQTPVNGGGGDPQTPPVLACPTREQTAKLGELNSGLQAAIRDVVAREQMLFPRAKGKPASASPRATVLKAEIVALLQVPPASRSRAQLEQLARLWEAAEPDYAALVKKQMQALDARDALQRAIPRVMVMEDMPAPRTTFLLTRGSYDKPANKVVAGVPAAVLPLPAGVAKNRLGLARWLVAADNPLTARVTVNRMWQQFFGIGLVKTTEDFGVQGERPSHPDLLDWLATELPRSGWDVKRMHRLIVTSAAYRQSSRVTAALAERDPQNRLLARGPRFRMPAWMLRDQALAASGLLVRKVGGPPVKPYQPAGVWEEATFGQKGYQQDHGEALYRRSVYTFWRRIVGPTLFFDSAPRQTCVVKPTRTNTPLHALTTLNDTTYLEAARVLAERVLTQASPTAEERVRLAFRLVLARAPTAEEMGVLLASLNRVRSEFAADPAAAKKLLAVGESKRNEKLDVVEHAAYSALCSVIFNLDEAVSKE